MWRMPSPTRASSSAEGGGQRMAHLDAVASRVIDDAEAEELNRTPVRSYWELARQRFLRNRMAVAGLVVLTLLVIGSIAIPALTGDTWQTALLFKVNAPPEIGTSADG